MRLYLFLLVCGLQGSFAQAATWYVATNGNDANTGALAAPFRTLPRALEAASPGDAIELRGGQYTSQEIRITQSNLTIRSFPGEWAVITAPVNNEDIASCIWYSDPDVTGGTLERLEIVGGYYYGVSFETNWDWGQPTRRGVSNVTIRGCKIHHTGRDCIKIKPACNNIHIIRCELYMSGIGPSNSPANGGPNAEGIDNVNGDGMVVRHCYIHDISTTGVYVKGGAKDCIVEQNLIYGVREAGILLGFYTDAEFFDQDGTNPAYYECQYSIARNNIVYNTGGAGIGLFAARNCAAYHNTVVTASGDFHAPLYLSPGEIWISDQTTLTPPNFNIEVYNNIFIDQSGTGDDDYTVQIREGALSGTTFINNNIFQKTNGAAQFTDGTHWPAWNFAEWKSQTGFDANSTEVYPALDANLHLMPNSPAIGAGRASPATVDYDGHPRTGAPDIGADDYANGTPLPVPPPLGTIGTGIDVAVGVRQPAPAVWQMEASPNPSSGHLRLAWPDGYHPQNVQLYDSHGRLVLASPAAPTLQLAHLPSGTYHLLATGRDGAWGRTTVVVE
jgi:hypothetical protein